MMIYLVYILLLAEINALDDNCGPPTIQFGKKFTGGEFHVEKVANEIRCYHLCWVTADCKAATYNNYSKECSLHKTRTGLVGTGLGNRFMSFYMERPLCQPYYNPCTRRPCPSGTTRHHVLPCSIVCRPTGNMNTTTRYTQKPTTFDFQVSKIHLKTSTKPEFDISTPPYGRKATSSGYEDLEDTKLLVLGEGRILAVDLKTEEQQILVANFNFVEQIIGVKYDVLKERVLLLRGVGLFVYEHGNPRTICGGIGFPSIFEVEGNLLFAAERTQLKMFDITRLCLMTGLTWMQPIEDITLSRRKRLVYASSRYRVDAVDFRLKNKQLKYDLSSTNPKGHKVLLAYCDKDSRLYISVGITLIIASENDSFMLSKFESPLVHKLMTYGQFLFVAIERKIHIMHGTHIIKRIPFDKYILSRNANMVFLPVPSRLYSRLPRL